MVVATDIEQVLLTVLLVLIGILGNMFNFVFTLQQQLKSRTIQTVSLILIVSSFSNTILVLTTLSLIVGVYLNPHIWCIKPYPFFLRTVIYLLLNFSCISFWSIAWLSLFYCIKVVSFSSECLQTLKKNISSIINAAVLLSFFFSSVLFTPMFSLDLIETPDNTSDWTNQTMNTSSSEACPPMPSFTINMNEDAYAAGVLCLLCPVPLMIMLPTSLRMVVHLCAHTIAMQKNQTQVQGSDSYLLVCKLTISLVGVYLSTLLFVTLFIVAKFIGAYITYIAMVFAFSFYSGMSSILLTASNRYLKEKLWSLFCCKKEQESVSKSHTVETVDS